MRRAEAELLRVAERGLGLRNGELAFDSIKRRWPWHVEGWVDFVLGDGCF